MPYAVVVTFAIKPGQMEFFLPLVQANARASVEQEPGCHQFDVATDPKRPNEVFLYEIYTDEAGFEAHKAMPHFTAFDAESAAMIAEKNVLTYETVQQ